MIKHSKLLVTIAVAIAFSAAAYPEDIPEKVHERYQEKQAKAVKVEVDRLKVIVKTFFSRVREYQKSTKDDPTKQRETIAAMRAEVDEARQKLKLAESGKLNVEPTLELVRDLKIGDVGVPIAPPDTKHMIYGLWLETVGDNTAIIAVFWMQNSVPVGHIPRSGYDPRIWVDGIDTTDLVNDRKITFDKCYYVSGTRSYTSVGGTKETIYVIKPYQKPSVPVEEETGKEGTEGGR